jgi:hypothetical protein
LPAVSSMSGRGNVSMQILATTRESAREVVYVVGPADATVS